MEKLLILLSISFATFGIIDDKIPISRALEFNKWYTNKINKDIYSISSSHEIDIRHNEKVALCARS